VINRNNEANEGAEQEDQEEEQELLPCGRLRFVQPAEPVWLGLRTLLQAMQVGLTPVLLWLAGGRQLLVCRLMTRKQDVQRE
jgi:hypothetical protein